MSNTYQKKSRRAQPDPMPAEVAVPEQVIVPMAEIAGAAKEGLRAGWPAQPWPGRVPARRRGRVGDPRRAAAAGEPAAGTGRGRVRGAAPAQL